MTVNYDNEFDIGSSSFAFRTGYFGTSSVVNGATLKAKADVDTIPGTTFTLIASDHNRVLKFTSNSDITLTIPSGLGASFACGVIQRGDGKITFTAGSGVTVVNPSSHTKSVKNGVVSIFADSADNFIVQGATQS